MYVRAGLGALGGGVLSPNELYQLALSAGFPSDTAVKMTAIALKESGGNPQAFNGVPPDESYGLWQINMIGDLGARRLALFGLSSKAQLFDPTVNARAAYITWGGNDANLDTAWYINSADAARYQQFLPIAIAAAGGGAAAPVDYQVSSLFPEVDLTPSGFLASLESLNPTALGITAAIAITLGFLFSSD